MVEVMNGYKISEAAKVTGFSVSALRYYEKQDVVVPGRTDAGYRSYREMDLEALRFVARAKRLGLHLGEITELLALLRGEDCAPMQNRMRHLMAKRAGEAQDQIAELETLTTQLQDAATRLSAHTPEGPCDSQCGCQHESVANNTDRGTMRIPIGSATVSVACSLESSLVGSRIDQWKAVAASAADSEPLADGIRLSFPRTVDVIGLTQLAADEQGCCAFFTFTIGIHSDRITLEVTGPPLAQPVISALLGAAAAH